MIAIETIKQLSDIELSMLRQLLGKNLVKLICSGHDIAQGSNSYESANAVFMAASGEADYLSITAEHTETNFGDSQNKLLIQSKNSSDINNYSRSASQKHLVPIDIGSEFIITKIEVYGDSYSVKSDNLDPDPIWSIEINNPGKKIIEKIETENTIVIYSANRIITIKPWGPVPLFTISIDAGIDHNLLNNTNLDGETVTKLKHTLE